MIPEFNISSVLPPFVGASSAERKGVSPYRCSSNELVERFACSSERIQLLHGLLDYRADLQKLGIIEGWQWLDGSFVEDVERTQNRSPNDIDLATFARVPGTASQQKQFALENLYLFEPGAARAKYGCDAYFIELGVRPQLLISDACYLQGLFSHQKQTHLWKGILQISLNTPEEDAAARLLLQQRTAQHRRGLC
ncbi:hypothetical protein V8J88_20505 [Massilia sp. W12]|uniref:DUF6932 family protein n=1 Tax=Massilia sp. W12 TaxID=3126507 RepID=UPI0030D51EE2